ncbi:acyl-CoA dehydrogenase family protein [Nonomuraea sp. 10N515B]|uniref:acyl-CoA dehydrogenase family protein n=1 Tax=Nonomuraea sp. 10N515B TaxID=3457422 RepID=UPI003FCE09AE
MNFDLAPEQRKRYDETLAGVRAELACPSSPATRAEWRAAGRLGLTGLCLPKEHGGSGLGALDTALCLEAFGRGCATAGLPFAVAAHLLACAVPIRDFASKESGLLAGLATGERIAANAMTEDGAGSDVGRLATTARRDGDAYVLDGEKSFASNAPLADVIVTYAVTDPTAGFLGITAFAVPRDLPGVEVGSPLEKMGLHGCAAARVRFSGCRVPDRYVLGRPGQGSAIFQHSMGWERACLFAVYLGLMDDQLDRVVAHARERRQFGREIGGFQAVSHRIAAMAQRLEGARLLLYRACWQLDQGHAGRVAAAAMSKAAVSEAAVANGLDAVQIFGAAGYLTGPGIEARLRDAVPSTIFSGTTEIQREIIAREVGL